MARLSPKAVKNAAKIETSSVEKFCPKKIAKLLAIEINSQLEKSLIHLKDTSYI